MSNFGGNAGQDWETVNVGRSTKPFKKPTQGDKKQSLTSAQRSVIAVQQCDAMSKGCYAIQSVRVDAYSTHDAPSTMSPVQLGKPR